MSVSHAVEAALVRGIAAAARATGWRRGLALGPGLGDAALALGLRRGVAEDNLAQAFPEWSAEHRRHVLHEHYREVGRVAMEYPRLPEMARAPWGEFVMRPEGLEHLERARDLKRGVVMMTGHFGNFELMGAAIGKVVPVQFLVRPLSNPRVDRWVVQGRIAAGVGVISADTQVRRVYERLRENDVVAMVADQDARRHGVFIPFLGRPASTALGPVRVALATGAPIVMAFILRRPDGRHEITVEPPFPREVRGAPDAVLQLTQMHVARVEAWVRRRPEHWLWLHRRWKTPPPALAAAA